MKLLNICVVLNIIFVVVLNIVMIQSNPTTTTTPIPIESVCLDNGRLVS